jgi:disulfide oxidoreductase YuzD|tara:strand:+ start:237 stop:575 length:339 start_codon:yes stop_codon:yes gene_type:complete
LIEHTIEIIIIDDSNREECVAGCGEDWSSPETLTSARQRIKDRFDDKIQLQYLDLSKAASDSDVLEWNEVINSKNLPLPLLAINGQPRISGLFDIRQLLDTIEVEIETGEEL